MIRPTVLMATILTASIVLANSCPKGDALLKNNTPLSQACPNGFGQQKFGSIQDQITTHQENTSMIVAAAEQQGVPADLALAVSYHESEGFNSCAGSATGVVGPMQLTKGTARSLGYDRDINEQNIQGGVAVLKQAVNACGATNYSCLSAHYNGSTVTQQAQWAAGVASADGKLKADPAMVASACSGDSDDKSCLVGGGDLPTTTTTGTATNVPAPAATDVVVLGDQV
jgi:hypothetical protein